MTVYVGTDFLLAVAKDTDWLQRSAEDALVEYDVETSPFSHLELLLARERYEFDYVPLVANLLELVPVRNEEEKQVVLKDDAVRRVPRGDCGNVRDGRTLFRERLRRNRGRTSPTGADRRGLTLDGG